MDNPYNSILVHSFNVIIVSSLDEQSIYAGGIVKIRVVHKVDNKPYEDSGLAISVKFVSVI